MTRRELLTLEATWHECVAKQSFYALAHLMQELVIEHCHPGVTARRAQLFQIAAARHVEHLITNPICRRTIELAEEASERSEGLYSPHLETHGAIVAAMDQYGPPPSFFPRPQLSPIETQAYELAAELANPEQAGVRVRYLGGPAATLAAIAAGAPDSNPEASYQIGLHRDIFGSLFLTPKLNRKMRTPKAVALAQRMYESQDFSVMPILADTLQAAGCEDADVLSHCRNPEQIHVRGCWVVDLVLGKG
ncbi:hypothetical protein VT84_33825 [Gemmata sp. SH-PL17]|nr:hypothetical protein VT84_33825 [Gemmata sp. SH-PL17]